MPKSLYDDPGIFPPLAPNCPLCPDNDRKEGFPAFRGDNINNHSPDIWMEFIAVEALYWRFECANLVKKKRYTESKVAKANAKKWQAFGELVRTNYEIHC